MGRGIEVGSYMAAQVQIVQAKKLVPRDAHKKELFSQSMLCLIECRLPQSLVGDYMDAHGLGTISECPHEAMERIFERCLFMLESAWEDYTEHDGHCSYWPDWIKAVADDAIMGEEEPYELLEVGKPFPITKEGF